mmetsp:Transcript_22516/g.60025  ORF Transcript_22516/g.60025 Transcript_22516/m.60025 type:complete len:234 (+) Transcript_22516:384-1085(+)
MHTIQQDGERLEWYVEFGRNSLLEIELGGPPLQGVFQGRAEQHLQSQRLEAGHLPARPRRTLPLRLAVQVRRLGVRGHRLPRPSCLRPAPGQEGGDVREDGARAAPAVHGQGAGARRVQRPLRPAAHLLRRQAHRGVRLRGGADGVPGAHREAGGGHAEARCWHERLRPPDGHSARTLPVKEHSRSRDRFYELGEAVLPEPHDLQQGGGALPGRLPLGALRVQALAPSSGCRR